MTGAATETERGDVAETFLVVVDRSPEARKALRFAVLRAFHTNARVLLVSVVEPEKYRQWGGVQETLEAEAEAEAWARLEEFAEAGKAMTGVKPSATVRRGKVAEEVLKLIRENRSIRALVLGAAEKGKPGPLVESFAGERVGSLPSMLIIIPGGISDENLDRLT